MRRIGLFLTLMALALAGPAQAADEPLVKINYEALDKLGWKLGSQASTFRAWSLLETIDVLDRLGLRYIEMYPGQRFSPDSKVIKADHNSMTDEMIERLKAKLKEKNITPMAYGVVNLP